MANGKIRFGKQSGGQLALVIPDGVSNTEVIVPESGNLVSVDTAVTDNSIARYDGTTGKLQNSGVTINDNGNVGIGTNNPTLSLEVSNGTNTGYIHPGFGIGLSVGTKNNSVLTFDTNNNERVRIDASGNLILTSGTGALGYGAGAGGTVTQLISRSTAVTLNKPSGTIYTHNESLANGASVSFIVYNNLVTVSDLVYVYGCDYTYFINIVADNTFGGNGSFNIRITNNSGYSVPHKLPINFVIIKGATA